MHWVSRVYRIKTSEKKFDLILKKTSLVLLGNSVNYKNTVTEDNPRKIKLDTALVTLGGLYHIMRGTEEKNR